MVKWSQAFFDDCQARVRINGTEGRYRTLKDGVPQGSVIAPLLFIMYVDDLPKKLQGEGVHTFLFADDLATSVEGNSVEEYEKRAERVSTLVSEWTKDWRMQRAPEKTTATLFTTSPKEANTKLKVGLEDTEVETVKHPKFLGVTMDRLFGYTEDAKQRKNRAIAGLRQLARLAGTDYGGRMEDLVLLEKTYIRSRTNNSGERWMPAACQTALNHLDVLQRTASRCITGETRNTNGDILHLQIRAPPARTRSTAGKLFERCKRQPPTSNQTGHRQKHTKTAKKHS